MMRVLTIAGVIGLVACAARTPESDVQRLCRDYANNDPGVKLIREIGAGQSIYMAEHQLELEAKLRTAEQKCLAAHGAAPRGGVAVGKRLWYDPLF